MMEMQKNIHLKPLKDKILWQDKIDKTVEQCKTILADAVADEKKLATKHALRIIPDKSIFDDQTVSLEEFKEE